MTTVFMFPGQSSRDSAMFERLTRLAPTLTSTTCQRASHLLGRDVAAHYQSDNPIMFNRNQDVQVGVFLANHVFLAALQRGGIAGELSLGLSLGEYNHLVHIGVLDFDSALRLVDKRGACYDQGPAGLMASVFPIALDELERVVGRARARGVVEVANHNSPLQFVLSGAAAAVEAAMDILEEEHYVQATIIERRVPMHASLFKAVAAAFRPALEAAVWAWPVKPYLPNVLGRFLDAPNPGILERHVYQPVLWRQSIDHVVDRHPDAVFINMAGRWIAPEEVADAVLGLCSGLMDGVSGQVINVDRGVTFSDNLMRLYHERAQLEL